MTFPNMWVDPPETPIRYVRWHNGGVEGNLPCILTPSTDYAIWSFDSLSYNSERTIVCTLIVLDNICGTYPNDIDLKAFVQVWSDQSNPTKTPDLSPNLIIRCRPGLVCEASIAPIGYSGGTEISVGSFASMMITLSACNYPYNDVLADSCLLYVLIPPESIAVFDSAVPPPCYFQTIIDPPYNEWCCLVWMVDLLPDSCRSVRVFITDATGMTDSCYEAYAGLKWNRDASRLWGTDSVPTPGFYDSTLVCEYTLKWCITAPDLVISFIHPMGHGMYFLWMAYLLQLGSQKHRQWYCSGRRSENNVCYKWNTCGEHNNCSFPIT